MKWEPSDDKGILTFFVPKFGHWRNGSGTLEDLLSMGPSKDLFTTRPQSFLRLRLLIGHMGHSSRKGSQLLPPQTETETRKP